MDFKPYTEVVLPPEKKRRQVVGEKRPAPSGKIREFHLPKNKGAENEPVEDARQDPSSREVSSSASTSVIRVREIKIPADTVDGKQQNISLDEGERLVLPVEMANLTGAANPPREIHLPKAASPAPQTESTGEANGSLVESETTAAPGENSGAVSVAAPAEIQEAEQPKAQELESEIQQIESKIQTVEPKIQTVEPKTPEESEPGKAVPDATPAKDDAVPPTDLPSSVRTGCVVMKSRVPPASEEVPPASEDSSPVVESIAEAPTQVLPRPAIQPEPYRDFIIAYNGEFIGHYRSARRITNRTAFQKVARALLSAAEDLDLTKLQLYKPIALKVELPGSIDDVLDGRFQWFAVDENDSAG